MDILDIRNDFVIVKWSRMFEDGSHFPAVPASFGKNFPVSVLPSALNEMSN